MTDALITRKLSSLFDQRWLRLAVIAAMVLGTVTIFALLLYREREFLLQYDWQLRWEWIVAGLIVMIVGLWVAAWTWADMMRTVGSQLSVRRHIRFYCLSHLTKRLPGTVWYLAGRGYLYKQQDESMRAVLAASGIEFVLTICAGAIVTLIFLNRLLFEAQSVSIIVIVVVIGLAGVLAHPRSVNWMLRRIRRENQPLDEVPALAYGDLLKWLVAHISLYLVGGAILFCVANAVIDLPLSTLPYAIGASSAVGTLSYAVFFLPTNMGVTELGLTYFLSSLMMPSLAVVVAILLRLFGVAYELLSAGLILLVLRGDEEEGKLRETTLE